MIDGQVRAGGVTEARLLSRLANVPREIFVPQNRIALAYVDDLHWFGQPGASRFMPSPATLAKLIHLAAIGVDDIVLDLGATTGYASAVLGRLCASVIGLESDVELGARALRNLADLGVGNVTIRAGDMRSISPASVDAVLVQGMVEDVPESWFSVLKEGGRLAALVRRGPIGIAHLFVSSGGKITARAEFSAFLPPLDGVRASQEFVF